MGPPTRSDIPHYLAAHQRGRGRGSRGTPGGGAVIPCEWILTVAKNASEKEFVLQEISKIVGRNRISS